MLSLSGVYAVLCCPVGAQWRGTPLLRPRLFLIAFACVQPFALLCFS